MTDRALPLPDPSRSVRDDVLALMRTLSDQIRIDGMMADQLSRISDRARLCGEDEMAEGLLEVVRQHRVAVLEGQGRLSALKEYCVTLFPEGLGSDRPI